ncbi:MAG: hypothetical protein LBE12_15855 [Planctomycetaceae bacterium]|nr:hypothetical protein [Planctomycetaceae bacterium]
MYRKGLSCNKIAIKLQVNAHVVINDLRIMGKHVKIQKTKAKRNAALIKERCEGKTISALSRKYKISEDRVKELIGNYNKTAEVPVPDFKQLRDIRLSKQLSKSKIRSSKSKIEIPKSKIEDSKSKLGISKSKLGISKSRHKKSAGKLKTTITPASVRLNRITAMYQSGTAVKVIAGKFKLSVARVYQLLKENISVPKKGTSKKGKK